MYRSSSSGSGDAEGFSFSSSAAEAAVGWCSSASSLVGEEGCSLTLEVSVGMMRAVELRIPAICDGWKIIM
jgi:hypothetical protein